MTIASLLLVSAVLVPLVLLVVDITIIRGRRATATAGAVSAPPEMRRSARISPGDGMVYRGPVRAR